MLLGDRLLCLLVILTSCALTSQANTFFRGPRQLTCRCNEQECGPQGTCVTSAHFESKCFKSVKREVEDGEYVWDERYGCFSGDDQNLFNLQCHANTLLHKEPLLIRCCNNNDLCNDQLPGPTVEDDPRWQEEKPPQDPLPPEVQLEKQAALWVVVLITVVLTCLVATLFFLIYRLSTSLYLCMKTAKKSTDSIDKARAFTFDEPLKSQLVNHHSPVESISDSDRTYTISDKLSPDHHYHDNRSPTLTEHTSTLADLTSGVGARRLEPRTMARVVENGSIQPVGSGRFGRVFRGTFNDRDVAVKAFQPIDQESWQREAKILSMLNHENIVRYMASEMYTVAATQLTETWMFLEFCPNGSLCDFLDQNEICGPQQAVKILYSIIEGLNYLHEDYSTGGGKPPIAHRDIKSKNILMRTPEVCCLADFGHAIIKVNHEQIDFGSYGCHRLQVGTVRYLAPEILKPTQALDTTQFYTFAQADLYQFSLILWEVCNRTALDVLHPAEAHQLPYDGVVPQNPALADMIKIVCDDNYRPPRPPHWQRYPEMRALSSLMEECWRANPKARMETLGVRKRIKKLFDQLPTLYYQNNLLDSAILASYYERSKNNDMTL